MGVSETSEEEPTTKVQVGGEPPKQRRSFQRTMVNIYRVAGFVILTAILIGLVSYLTTQLFFLFNRSWIAPAIVTPTDDRVMQLNAELAERTSERDKVKADRAMVVAQLEDARRTMALLDEFEGAFTRALASDLSSRRAELKALEQLTARYRETRKEIEESNKAYAGMSRERLAEERQAGLIPKDAWLSGNYQIAQIASANLSLAEREALLEERATKLRRETAAYASARSTRGPLSYETLRLKEELRRNKLEAQRARDQVAAHQQRLGAIDKVIARYDKLIKDIVNSPHLLATEHNLTVAFLPYENLHNFAAGQNIYACRMRVFWCREVGQVKRALNGEVAQKHPLKNESLRGQMVHIELKEPDAAQLRLLFLGRPPLFF